MSAFVMICAIITVVFWRSVLKIAAILAIALMVFGALALLEGLHHIVR